MTVETQNVAVVGGGVSGLAAAEALNRLAKIGTVQLFERQEYDDKRVNCGEAINDASLIPLKKTAANGFTNNIDGVELQVYANSSCSAELLQTSRFPCGPGYICERDTVEMRWAERLKRSGVQITTGENISASCSSATLSSSLCTPNYQCNTGAVVSAYPG